MTSINSKVLVVLLIIGMAAIPALGNSGGPPYLNQDGDPTVKYGCSCHNNGAVSERAVVMITSCLLYTSPSPRDGLLYRMPSSA